MATRLYLSASPAEYAPPTVRGSWGDSGLSANVYALSPSRAGTNAIISRAEADSTNPRTVLLHRHVSEPLQGGLMPASATFTHTEARQQSSTSAVMTVRLMIYFTVGDTDEIRGVWLDPFVGATSFATTMTAFSYSLAGTREVAVSPGDRMVVEIGYNAANTSTTSFTGSMRVGGTSADLATTGTTGVTTNSPWMEFSTSADAVLVTYAPVDRVASPADTAAATDGVTRAATSPRTAGDAVGATDALRVAVGRRVSDSAGQADALTMEAQRIRLPADKVGAVDSVVMVRTRAALQDYQFALDAEPYVPFGIGETIAVEKFTPGPATMRTQDLDSAVADVRYFGTDLKTPPTWSWDLYTDTYTTTEALAWMENLADVWDAENLRREPNKVIPLLYGIGGRIRRVYGRPRNFSQIPGDLIQNGKALITADFALAEALFYEDTEENTGLVQMLPESRGSGWTFPLKFPIKSRIPDIPAQVAQARIGGRKPTWISIDFHGPVVDPWIQIGGLRWALRGSIEHDRTVTMTGIPWDMGVRRDDGAYLPGMLDPRARLSQLRLPPGVYPVSYGGFDPTGTSTALVRWRNAYGAM